MQSVQTTLIIIHTLTPTVVTIEFTQTVFTISESEEALLLCASLTGQRERDVSVSLTDILVNATQDDFNLNQRMLTFIVESRQECARIEIIQDGLFEDVEVFQVILQSNDDSVRIGDSATSTITIINSDGKCMWLQ